MGKSANHSLVKREFEAVLKRRQWYIKSLVNQLVIRQYEYHQEQVLGILKCNFTEQLYASAVCAVCLCQLHAGIVSKRLNLGPRKQLHTIVHEL